VKRVLLLALVLAACNDDIDESWVLDHDRIIAVRAEPPGIVAGETSKLDLLAGYKDKAMPAETRKPDVATVVSPMSLASAVAFDGTDWVVTAPSDDAIAAARTELGLDADAPVPLTVGVAAAWPYPVVSPDPNGFAATKIVWLGEQRANPVLEGLTIEGMEMPPEGTPLVISAMKDYRTRFTVDADDEVNIISWLSSCGTVHDDDLRAASISVDKDDDCTDSQLAIVLRAPDGGVTWRLWPLTAQ
jgi:hypothetical protein